jgi:hypothetical protein
MLNVNSCLHLRCRRLSRQCYFWVNGEFTPRETMRGKMALLAYLYAIR